VGVRSYRGANCDTDHFLVNVKFKIKLKCPEKIRTEKRPRINIEMLGDTKVRKQYETAIDKAAKKIDVNNIDTDWKAIREVITETAEQSVGVLKKSQNRWYKFNCQKAIEKYRKTREDHLR